mgnify:FL=1
MGADPATIGAIAAVAGPVMGQMMGGQEKGGAAGPLGQSPPVTAVGAPSGMNPMRPFVSPISRGPLRSPVSPSSFEDLLMELLKRQGLMGPGA